VLKEEGEAALSIFSDEIEKEDYLPKGSVFKFLRCISQAILKEKRIDISGSKLDEGCRDVLKMITLKELSREEDELVKYLPQLLTTALYTR
jgi:hypothetical protein